MDSFSPDINVPVNIEVPSEFHRLGLLLGETVFAELKQKRVIIIGLGGVGSWAAEALVRSGIGRITIVDSDLVDITNINRQIQALPGTVGFPKAAALMKRLLEINPQCEVTAFNKAFSRETAVLFGIESSDYVIDAIDSLNCKLDLIQFAEKTNTTASGSPVLFSSMGMASRLDPTRLITADIWESSGCPLARLVRQGLKKRGFTGHFTVVYSDEPVIQNEKIVPSCEPKGKKFINGSAVPVTAAAGMILASLVIQDVFYNRSPNEEGYG
ncbi:MAG: tRNA threonylcarbamoyladenosine dehydratase [Treponema sp.]|nr:tRNA threonylcarbamoyladenosine dehydratase [Treponema sp.]